MEHVPTFGTHGMLIVGEKNVFLSHLPMFMFDPEHHPHNFQVILGVNLASPAKGKEDPKAVYVNDRRQHPNTRVYTLVPQDFELADLDPERPKRHSFIGTMHRGHFERHDEDGGGPLVDAAIEVQKVICFRPFSQGGKKPPNPEYLLFGGSGELFAAHLIVSPPDFDQVVNVQIEGHPPTDEDLGRGVHIVVPGRENTARTRLKARQRVAAEVNGSRKTAPPTVKLQIEVLKELYFEEGELGSPFTSAQTAEEKLAGF
jgi:hypothetical protein